MVRPLFLQPPYIYVLFATAAVLSLREGVARRIWRAEEDTPLDRGSFRVLWAATAVGTAMAITVPLTSVGSLATPVLAFWTGIALMLLGLFVRLYAMFVLGDLFSHRVAVKDDHEVVDVGPYRWVRHPSYTGALITYLGIGVVTGNWVSVVAAVGGAVVGYSHRVRVEERALSEALEGYEEYAERTPYRLVPSVW